VLQRVLRGFTRSRCTSNEWKRICNASGHQERHTDRFIVVYESQSVWW